MQDSLCGSMGPLAPTSSSSTDLFAAPSSPSRASSSSIVTRDHPDSDLPAGYADHSISKPDDSLQSPPSPESANLSSWIDMIDELIEQPPEPMLFSPSRDSVAEITSPALSSLGDNFVENQQTFVGSPSLNSACQPFESTKEVTQGNSSPLVSYLESYQVPPQKHAVRSHVQQFFSPHTQQQSPLASRIRSPKSPYHQPSSALHKVLSAPQLSRTECLARSPRTHSPLPPLSLPPAIISSSSSQSLLQTRNSTAIVSDLNRLSRRSPGISVPRSISPSSLYPSSPPKLPRSLPSIGSLSYRMNQPRSPVMMQSIQHQRALQPNVSMKPTPIDQREFLAGLSQRQPPGMVPLMGASGRMQSETQDSGLRLVHLLLACAEAVAREDFFRARQSLAELQQNVSTNGDSMQRVAAYFADALKARLMGTGNRSYIMLRSYDPATADEVLAAYQILYQACPYIKFAHFTSNQAIFEAFDGEEMVHIVDLDILQGYQWPAFIQALAARPGGAPHLRITGVGMPPESVEETGRRLANLAESLHVPFEFHAVGERLENLKAYMFQRRVGEALAVNSVYRLHRLLSEPMSPFLGVIHMIREQVPNIFTLVEQEATHNGPFFLGRFLEALHYYSAIFDSLDATLPQTSPERTKVEQVVFSQEITNIVACEGAERIERHEKLERWRKMMDGIGFQNVPLSANAVNQSKILLGLYPCDGYTLVEDSGSLLLGWQDRPIIAASAWRC